MSMENDLALKPLASAQARAEVYIGDHLDQFEYESACELANAFSDSQKPMQRTAVMIPVAAHQDADYIFHTASEYAKQSYREPFTVFMLLNMPDSDQAETHFLRAMAEADRAKTAFPELDLRYAFELNLFDNMTIGSIRRELWNSVFILAEREGLFSHDSCEVIGINNDIDTTFISPHYISRIQQYYQTRQAHARQLGIAQPRLEPVGTHLTHATLASHPNVGKVTSWVDVSYFQGPSHVNYEAGLVIPFSHYAHVGGFDNNDATYETGRFTEGKSLHNLTGAQLRTHPRRYIDRLSEHGTTEIWTDDSFGDSDQCRQQLAADISDDRVETVILENLERDIKWFWLGGAISRLVQRLQKQPDLMTGKSQIPDTVKQLTALTIDKQLQRAERFMDTFVGSPTLKSLVRESIDFDDEVNMTLSILSTESWLFQ